MEWSAFEERLTELGYGPRAIAHAFGTLSGPGTVDEALEVLKRMSQPEMPPIALNFEVTETCGGPSAPNGVTITSVERDDLGIRVNYDSVLPVDFGSAGPRGEAKDDLGNDYDNLGSHFGRARDGWHGGFRMPLTLPAATTLRIRIAWEASRHRSGRDQRTKSVSRFWIERFRQPAGVAELPLSRSGALSTALPLSAVAVGQRGSVRLGLETSGMPQNFIAFDRDQVLLMPPDLRDWLSEDHLVWTVLGAVGEMDLSAFYAAYRPDGHGRAAYEPSLMVGLLLYAYARGNRSSRGIERECQEDVAYRVVAANLVPDHSTIADFRKRHEAAIAGLFGEVLGLCREAGMVRVGVIAVDGTKVQASASNHANRDYQRVARDILAEADRIDREEDELYGEARGDELPERLRTAEGRRTALREAKRKLEEQRTAKQVAERPDDLVESDGLVELDPEQIVERVQGRRGWLREAHHQLDERRRRQAIAIPRSRAERLLESERRLREELAVEHAANEAYEAYRARGVMKDGRRFGGPPKPYVPPQEPDGKINLTDPDSRNVKAFRGYVQGYNAQAVVTEQQIVIAAEVNSDSPDFGHLEPMITAAREELANAGVTEELNVALADSGYWHHQQMDQLAADGIQVLIPPDAAKRKGTRPGWDGGRYSWMRHLLAGELGGRLYRRRSPTIEPVFAQMKFNRRIDRFQRRGHSAVRSEWRLAAATHNLLKLHNHQISTQRA